MWQLFRNIVKIKELFCFFIPWGQKLRIGDHTAIRTLINRYRSDEWNTNLMRLAILFHLLCAQHVSDINISIFRSLRLCWWITTSVVLFSVRCVLELLVWLVFGGFRFAGWSLQNEHHRLKPAKRTPPNTSRTKSSNIQRTENKTTDVVIHQQSRKLLKMDILRSETCWAHNKWNKIASDIKLVFHSST